jgi:Carbohydrate-binding family 9
LDLNAGSLPVLDVPLLGPTDRLVSLPRLSLLDARTGAAPRLATSVRVGLRGRALCVRFDGRDAGVVATYARRDEPLWEEDVFEIFLAPRERPTVYFEFEVNPLGALFDARIESPELSRATMRTETDWSCPGFEARVTRRDDRWSASVHVPLDPLLDGPSPPPVWRANFYRIDRVTNGAADEFSAWSPTLADPADFHVPERFGLLRLGL